MDDDWESENFQPKVEFAAPVVDDKWKGEDEDDDVKESWEDEEDEKKDVEKAPVVEVKPKKKLEEKIAEREKKRQDELARKLLEREETSDWKDLTPEEKLAEKLRIQKLQEEADLLLAKETFGLSDSTSIDSFHPSTKDEFAELNAMICKKVQLYSSNPLWPDFVEELIRDLCVPLNSNDTRKIKTTIGNMLIEKQKAEKEKTKKPKPGKTKVKLLVDNEIDQYGDFNDYDDFM